MCNMIGFRAKCLEHYFVSSNMLTFHSLLTAIMCSSVIIFVEQHMWQQYVVFLFIICLQQRLESVYSSSWEPISSSPTVDPGVDGLKSLQLTAKLFD